MSGPTTTAWDRLKRLGRYLVRVPRLVQCLERQPPFGLQRRLLENEKVDLVRYAIPWATFPEDAVRDAGADRAQERRERVVRFGPRGLRRLVHETSCPRPRANA